MSLNTTAALDSIASHALALGIFEQVNLHEPKNSPGSGLTAAVWVQDIGPVPASSGLGSTSARVEYTVRLYTNMLAEPQDMIDPQMTGAVDTLFAAYTGDLDLGASVRCVDLLGQAGIPLSARAGYLNVEGKMFRIMDITLPLIINDAWSQA